MKDAVSAAGLAGKAVPVDAATRETVAAGAERRSAQTALPLDLPARSTFDAFCVGTNAELVERLRRQRERFACVWLFGGAGVGKTHLLQAVCLSRPRSAYIPAARISAAGASIDAYGDCLNVAIDDVQHWLNDRAAEVALFDLYNRVLANEGELLLTADRSPRELVFALNDLSSRFAAAACYHVAPLEDQGKAQLLVKNAKERGLLLSDDVVFFLLSRIGRDQRHLLDILEQLDRSSLAAQRRITIPFVREILCI